MKTNDGGPAFPVQTRHVDEITNNNGEPVATVTRDTGFITGMSLRAYIATAALPSMIGLINQRDIERMQPEQMHATCAVGAVLFADALIAELNKERE